MDGEMIAGIFGGSGGDGGVVLVVVLVLLVLRIGYSATRAQQRRRVAEQRHTADSYADISRASSSGTFDLPENLIFDKPENLQFSRPIGSRPDIGDLVLDVSQLTVAYGPKIAVDDINLQVARGEIFGLLGPNGAGKTSTLSAVEGLLKPRSGTVRIDGIDVAVDPIDAKSRMGVQLQATSFQSELNVRQIVRLYAGLYGVSMTETDIAGNLDRIGLGGEANKPFKQLSGGQQQRLSLFVAVIHEPALLLLDEPTSGLDPQSRRQLWGRIERIRADGGSILLTTHSMEEAQAVCDRVAIIDHGKVLTVDTPKGLIEKHKDDQRVRAVSRGEVTLEDVFIGLTGSEIRE